jgi:hypothetical protein
VFDLLILFEKRPAVSSTKFVKTSDDSKSKDTFILSIVGSLNPDVIKEFLRLFSS